MNDSTLGIPAVRHSRKHITDPAFRILDTHVLRRNFDIVSLMSDRINKRDDDVRSI